MDSGYSLVRVCRTFMAGVSCSTFDIGPWTYNLSLFFVKLYSCQSSKEKHCKNLVKFSIILCIIKVVGYS